MESPKAPLPTIKIDEDVSGDAEEAIAREAKTFRNTITVQKKRNEKKRCQEKSSYMSPNGVQVPMVGRYRCLKGVRRLGTVDTSWLQGSFDATERLGRRIERFEASI